MIDKENVFDRINKRRLALFIGRMIAELLDACTDDGVLDLQAFDKAMQAIAADKPLSDMVQSETTRDGDRVTYKLRIKTQNISLKDDVLLTLSVTSGTAEPTAVVDVLDTTLSI